MGILRPGQVEEYFERDYFGDFAHFESLLYTCVECGALVSEYYKGRHAEWHERIGRDDDD